MIQSAHTFQPWTTATGIDQRTAMALKCRQSLIKMAYEAKASHLGSGLSCIDLLVACYADFVRPAASDNPGNRDRLIFSKGHAVGALYATLAHCDYFPLDWLDRYNRQDSMLPQQPRPNLGPDGIPGMEWATGSLGHGLSVALGIALAHKIKDSSARTIAVMSDGELNEGSVWEAAQFASAQSVAGLSAIVDMNQWQATGRTKDILPQHQMAERWRAFGWQVTEVNGHDFNELCPALQSAIEATAQPHMILAHTTKGRGVSFMEDDNNWHYRIANEQEFNDAIEELEAQQK